MFNAIRRKAKDAEEIVAWYRQQKATQVGASQLRTAMRGLLDLDAHGQRRLHEVLEGVVQGDQGARAGEVKPSASAKGGSQVEDKMESLIGHLIAQRWHRLHGGLPRLGNGQYPGVYLLAYSDQDLDGQPIDLQDVFYVGMSNSQGGVKQRVRYFVQAIEKEGNHAAGNRFRSEYAGGRPYSQFGSRKQFFVSWVAVPCQVDKAERMPDDLRAMGDVAALEYYVLARIRERVGREPELNKK